MPVRSQSLSLATLQTRYPLTGLTWLGGILLFELYLVGGISITQLPVVDWLGLFLANTALGFALFQMVSRYNPGGARAPELEPDGQALDLMTGPVLCAAAMAQLAGRPLVYVVTAKGSAATGDTWRTFRPHRLWLGTAVASIIAGFGLDHECPTLRFWAGLVAARPRPHGPGRRWPDGGEDPVRPVGAAAGRPAPPCRRGARRLGRHYPRAAAGAAGRPGDGSRRVGACG